MELLTLVQSLLRFYDCNSSNDPWQKIYVSYIETKIIFIDHLIHTKDYENNIFIFLYFLNIDLNILNFKQIVQALMAFHWFKDNII